MVILWKVSFNGHHIGSACAILLSPSVIFSLLHSNCCSLVISRTIICMCYKHRIHSKLFSDGFEYLAIFGKIVCLLNTNFVLFLEPTTYTENALAQACES